jgi:RND family efflux transporter MFP subunit
VKNYLIILVACSLIFSSCKKEIEQKEKIRPVKTIKIGDLTDYTSATFPGISQELQLAEMAFKVSGPLVKLNAYEGQSVKKGQLIAEIDARDFQVDLTAKQGRYIQAKAEKDRYESLLKNKSVSKNEYDQRLAKYLEAKAAYNAAQNALDDTKLRAPFTAFIDQKYVENYERVGIGQPIVSLLDLSAIEIKFSIPEMIAIQYRQFSNFIVSFDIYPDQTFEAILKEIGKKSVGSAGITVTLVLNHKNSPDNKYKIIPGLSCNIKIVLDETLDETLSEEEQGILVPITAVYEMPDSDERYVWIVNTETMLVNKRAVRTGILAGKDLIYILEGIQNGEHLITAGGNLLTEDQKVKFIVTKENK